VLLGSGSAMERRGTAAAIAIAIGVLAIVVSAPSRALIGRHYTLEEGVRLGPEMAVLLERISSEFHRQTGRGIVVTSGTRSPREQAEAMYDKIRLGQRLTRLYADADAATEIQTAYRRSQRSGRAPCIAAMARVIEAQMARGLFISRHLHASAVDIRSRDMNRRQRRAFVSVVERFPEIELIQEGVPPHFHLELESAR
jgi:hypothetical protein